MSWYFSEGAMIALRDNEFTVVNRIWKSAGVAVLELSHKECDETFVAAIRAKGGEYDWIVEPVNQKDIRKDCENVVTRMNTGCFSGFQANRMAVVLMLIDFTTNGGAFSHA